MADYKGSHQEFYASPNHEAQSGANKYGGLTPKKKPLISKDNERAFFDSADWALCKQGAAGVLNEKMTIAIETLTPKLKRTPHQQLPPRRPAFTSGRDILHCNMDSLVRGGEN
ncbi:hypothetical protein ACFE04_005100 [Oxalis oulophora]